MWRRELPSSFFRAFTAGRVQKLDGFPGEKELPGERK